MLYIKNRETENARPERIRARREDDRLDIIVTDWFMWIIFLYVVAVKLKYIYRCDKCNFELVYETDGKPPENVKCPNCKIKLEVQNENRQRKDIKVS